MKLIIVSGRSGSGKSILLRHLEDLGYYVVDNLPFQLLPQLLETLFKTHTAIAVSLDSRNLPENPTETEALLHTLNDSKYDVDIIYLDANDSTLLKRYSESRRKHPLSNKTVSLQEAIAKERVLLEPIVNKADLMIDTHSLHAHDLMNILRQRVLPRDVHSLSLLFQSFGYKYGIPRDADYVFDVRSLPNPYWEAELRPFTGLDKPVIDFLSKHQSVQEMETAITAFLEKFIPTFEADRRSYLTVAIGCTGGQHRSVYLVERLAAHFRRAYSNVQIRHREVKS
jgi:UPF0042 nucleotide-binding protein